MDDPGSDESPASAEGADGIDADAPTAEAPAVEPEEEPTAEAPEPAGAGAVGPGSDPEPAAGAEPQATPDLEPTPATGQSFEPVAMPAAAAAPSVEELTAERDALAAQVATLAGQESKHRLRRLGAVVLVILFAISFLASSVGIWLHRNTLNSDVWQERVVPLGEDPAVQAALASWTTDQIMTTLNPQKYLTSALPERADILAVPLTGVVRNFVSGKVSDFYASDRFVALWKTAATKAHDAAIKTLRGDAPAVTANSESVTINLIPLIDAVLDQILAAAPGIVGSSVTLPKISIEDVPSAARQKLADALHIKHLDKDFGQITIYDQGKLNTAQQFIKIFDKVVVLSTILAFATFIGALALSVRRRRTLLQLAGAAALVCILLRRVCFMLQDDVTHLIKVAINRPAATVIVATFADPLTHAAEIALWVIAIITVIAVVTGPYGWVVRMRTAIAHAFTTATATVGDRAQDDETLVWVAKHVDALRIGGWVLAGVAIWVADLNWLKFFLIAALLAGWQVLVARLALKGESLADQGPDSGDPGGPEAVAG